MSITVLDTRDGMNNTDKILLTSRRVRMGIVYTNRSSNTTCQAVRIIMENSTAGEGGEGQKGGVTILYGEGVRECFSNEVSFRERSKGREESG